MSKGHQAADSIGEKLSESSRGVGEFFAGIGSHISNLPAEQLANAGEILLKRINGFDVTVGGTVFHIGPIEWKEGEHG